MREYPKIKSFYRRHREGPNRGRFIVSAWTCPEFEYLQGLEWRWTEKVDGTNVRVGWDGESALIGGRTNKAQMYLPLVEHVREVCAPEVMATVFDRDRDAPDGPPDVCVYGEGYGAKIQKAGGNYCPDGGVKFVVFDIRIGSWWLKWEDVKGICGEAGWPVVPSYGTGTLAEAESAVRQGLVSHWGSFFAEGLVCRPMVDLRMRNGERVIAKVKTKDY